MALKSGGPCTFGPPLPENGVTTPGPPHAGSPLASYNVVIRFRRATSAVTKCSLSDSSIELSLWLVTYVQIKNRGRTYVRL